MKVNGPSRTNATYEPRGTLKSEDARPTTSAERVRISGQAQALADARAPESIDSQKVARLRESFEKGTFKIDLDRIADAMLREET